MIDTKVNLVVVAPKGTMMSEQECSKQLKKPVIIKKGKFAGKQAKVKGELLWHYETVPDLTKYHKNVLKIRTTSDKGKEVETLIFFTRKNREVRQVLNISKEAYLYFISEETPFNYHPSKDFKPTNPVRSHKDRKTGEWVEGTPVSNQSWKTLSPTQRLEWHLDAIAQDLGGKVESYSIFND